MNDSSVNDVFIDTSENVIYRLDISSNTAKTRSWVAVGKATDPQINFEKNCPMLIQRVKIIYLLILENVFYRLDVSSTIQKVGIN